MPSIRWRRPGTPSRSEERRVGKGERCRRDDDNTRRHTTLVSDWSSDVCSSDLKKTSLRANLRDQGSRLMGLTASVGYVSSNLALPQNDNNDQGIVSSGLLGYAFDTVAPTGNPLKIGRASCRERGEMQAGRRQH